MKKPGLYALLAVIVLIVVMVLTCPSRESHVTEIKQISSRVFDEYIHQEYGEMAGRFGGLGQTALALGSMFGTQVTEKAVENYLRVDNYFIVSIGHVEYEGEKYPVSVGAFGHIFTQRNTEKIIGMINNY